MFSEGEVPVTRLSTFTNWLRPFRLLLIERLGSFLGPFGFACPALLLMISFLWAKPVECHRRHVPAGKLPSEVALGLVMISYPWNR